MRKNTCGGLPVANLHLENVKMNDLNRNLLATVATQNGDFSDVLKELETAKANLAEAQDIIARANRFQNVMLDLFSQPLKEMVKEEIAMVGINAPEFDIDDYSDEIRNLASEQIDLERPEFDIDEYTTDIEDVVRQVLSGATVTLDI